MSDKPLTPKQAKFVAEYLGGANGNGAEAARRAGYKGNPHTLSQVAAENLTKPAIASVIAAHRAATVSDGILTAQECAVWLSGVIIGRVTELEVTKGTDDDFVENERPAKIKDRVTAVGVLAKLRGYDKPADASATPAAPSVSPDMERALIRLAELTPEQWAAWQAGVGS